MICCGAPYIKGCVYRYKWSVREKPPWSAAVFDDLAAAAGEVVAFAVFEDELARTEVDDV